MMATAANSADAMFDSDAASVSSSPVTAIMAASIGRERALLSRTMLFSLSGCLSVLASAASSIAFFMYRL